MTRVYLRREGDRREKLGALAVSLGVAVSVGAVAYYLARMLMSRDAIELEPPVARVPRGAVTRLAKRGNG